MLPSGHVMDDSGTLNGIADSAKAPGSASMPSTHSPRQLADATNLQERGAVPVTHPAPTGQTQLVSASSAGMDVAMLTHTGHTLMQVMQSSCESSGTHACDTHVIYRAQLKVICLSCKCYDASQMTMHMG